jgi:hypothetical protein
VIRRPTWFALLLVVLPTLLLGGCAPEAWDQAGQDSEAGRLAPPEDIFKAVCMYHPPYWKNYRPDRADRIEGFKCNLYLLSRETGRGVHTTGVLQTRMFLRQKMPDGSNARAEVCSWTQPLEDTPRTTRRYELGWAYQPHYYWGDLDLSGKEIEIVMWYESPTGRKIYAQSRRDKVPFRN